jgi:hypothetical protein
VRAPESARLQQPVENARWTATGNLLRPRQYAGSALLPSGQVLIIGGVTAEETATASCERYDPVTGTFVATTGSLNAARIRPTVNVLRNGKVLVTGGASPTAALSSAELYDPVTDAWTLAAPMPGPRLRHTGTVLADGRVLIIGGEPVPDTEPMDSAVIYDPVSGGWTSTGSMDNDRRNHAAVLLTDGRVLVAGGENDDADDLSSVEIWSPGGAGEFNDAPSLNNPREFHSMVVLGDGKVLVVGGRAGVNQLNTSELWDPAAPNSWTALISQLSVARIPGATALLPTGKVIVAGGEITGGASTAVDVFDPVTRQFEPSTSLSVARAQPAAALLASGELFLAGGTGLLSSSTRYDPSIASWTRTAPLDVARARTRAIRLLDGRVLITGGRDPSGAALSSVQLFDPQSASWRAGAAMAQARFDHGAVLLRSGQVLVVGGWGSAALDSTEIYDPSRDRWTTVGPLAAALRPGPVVTLESGQLLRVGGSNALDASGATRSAELFNPLTGRWTLTGDLAAARADHTATLLPDGSVFVFGGANGTGVLGSSEFYTAATGTWTAGVSSTPRSRHTATLLRDNLVLVTGGRDASGLLASVVAFAAPTQMVIPRDPLPSARERHQALLMSNGRVLITEGEDGVAGARGNAILLIPETGAYVSLPGTSLERADGTLTALSDGRLLIAGGEAAQEATVVELFSPASPPAWRPRLLPIGFNRGSGVLTGAELTGRSEASSGLFNDSSTAHPIVIARRADTGLPQPLSWTRAAASEIQATLPSAPGIYFVRVVVSGSASEERAVVVGAPGTAGAICAENRDCDSGTCAQGVCCDRACGGGCEACSLLGGASQNGRCEALPAGQVCRSPAGACDVAEQCGASGGVCPPDTFAPAGQVCRAPTGSCDAAEQCGGGVAQCPNDLSAPDGAACSDGKLCNGAETCLTGACQPGTPRVCGPEAGQPMFCSEAAAGQCLPEIAPTITSEPPVRAECAVELRHQATSSLPPGSPGLSWALEGAPEGMAVDPLSGLLTWTPPFFRAGPRTAVLIATNEVGADRQPLRIDVSCQAQRFNTSCEGCTAGGQPGAAVAALLFAWWSRRRRC